MSATHGDLSGARPKHEYSACEQSLTHITLGSGASIQQYPQSPQHVSHHHLHHQHQYSHQHSDGAAVAALHQLPSGGVDHFESHSGLGGGGGLQQPNIQSQSFHETRLGSVPCVGDSQASPQDFLCPPQVYDNSMMLREQGIGGNGPGGSGPCVDPEDNINEDNDDRDGPDGVDDGADGNSQGSGKRSRTRRPHLQGRFSGRLTTKEDERRLAEECKLLGPLLGGVGKRGDKSRLTLAKIVRGIATGDVRRFCEERERAIATLKAKLAAIDPEAAASVPINAIPLPSAGLSSMSGLGGFGLGPMSGLGGSMGGMSLSGGGGLGGSSALGLGGGLAVHGPQLEKLQRENSELRSEVYGLRIELQARERLLLELQDTGIISGFVPTSIPLDDPQRLLSHPGAGPGAGGHHHLGGGGRAHSAEMAPSYSMPPQRHHSYSAQPMAHSYGGPSQMSLPQSSAHVSSVMETGPMGGGGGGGGALGMGPGGGGSGGMGQQAAGGPAGMHPVGGGPMVGESSALVVVPAMSEHSRASRSLKRPALPEMGGGGGGGAYAEVPRSLSHPPLGRGGGGGGAYPHIDLQQQLNSLQAQVEQLQNMSAAQVSGRSAASYLMPARDRGGPQGRMGMGVGGGAQLHYGGGGMLASPFVSSHNSGAQGGLLMLPANQGGSDTTGHPFQAHPSIGGPLHLQVIKQSGLYDDGDGGGVGGSGGSRDARDPVGIRYAGGGGAAVHGGAHDGYGDAGIGDALEHIMSSRVVRGEYDMPLELLLPDKGGGGSGAVPH